MNERDPDDGWDSPYWSTLYHGHRFVRTFAELDELAKEEQARADACRQPREGGKEKP